ncbi:hypothetical protein POL68_10370 [Stigmatella sp. ncwal1]|uniref:Uncharacterized protein n=1 Tax=Stigmatella ashevillensis TaxID=2995309 RepID=A0ABT5D5C4_9BACT|nr:hypothetical protein [Stigmatella ashevillena]MDC0708870.1 hypothetical protein [Stigmatella ashevillena]
MVRQGIRGGRGPSLAWGLAVLLALAAPRGQAAGTVLAEVSATPDAWAWALLGDVEVRQDETFLTLGYNGTRPEQGIAPSHQFSVGVDHALSLHWLVSGAVSVGLPNTTETPLIRERPRRGLPALDAETSYGSQGLLLSAGYDSGGLAEVRYGLDGGLSLTRYPLGREIIARRAQQAPSVLFSREEPLWMARPSLGLRWMPGLRWELGLRGGLYLYSDDPLSVGQFTPQEQRALAERSAEASEERILERVFRRRIYRQLASGVSGRAAEVNAVAGFPLAPARFDLKPSVTYRFGGAVRGQLSYGFTRYVPGQGVSHLLGTRWTFSFGEDFRLWGAVALQVDVPEDSTTTRAGLGTLGTDYSF